MNNRYALVTCLGIAFSLAFAASALAADSAAPAPATKAADPAARKSDPGVGEAISLERAARKQWLDLIQAMTQVARELEKSEPDSARVIAAAAQKAQEALIGDDMAKVIQFLEDGMIVPADATQADIIKKLKDVLETLRGGDMRLKDRLAQIAEWKKYLKEIDQNLQRQKELEEHSRQVAFGEQEAKGLEDLASEVKELAAKEREIAKATDGLAADPNVKKLVDAREAVRALLRKQDALGKVTESAGAGQMALASEAQKALGTEADKVKDTLGEPAKDPPLAKAMEDAGVKPNAAQAAAESTAKAGGEMKQATSALEKSDAPAASTAQGTASSHLRDAEKALSDAIDKMGGKKPAGQLAARQEDLKKKADDVAAKVDKATGAQPSGQPSESGKPSESGQPSPKNNVAKAAEHMGRAAEHLKDQDQPSALDREKKAIESLEAQAKELQKKAGDVREAMKNPDHPGQKGKQDELAQQSKDLASKMLGKPSDPSGQPPAPGQPSVQKASQNQQQAGQSLGQQKPSEANKDQNEAEKNLEDAKKELADAIQKEQDAAQQQALAQIETMLRKVLESQKRLSTGTKDTQAKAKPDGKFERTESVRLADLADGEGKLAEDTQGIAKLLDDEGTTIVFPSVLRDVREDMAKTQELLASLQPGALAQGIQKEIEDRLQEMIDALQKEMSDRRQKDQQGKGQGKGQKQPLVPPIAELKMLRSLQVQINNRTVLLAETSKANQAAPDVIKLQHKVLSDRQNTVGKMTRDLAETLKKQQ